MQSKAMVFLLLLGLVMPLGACNLGGREETEETRGGEADEEDDQDEKNDQEDD